MNKEIDFEKLKIEVDRVKELLKDTKTIEEERQKKLKLKKRFGKYAID